MYIYSMVLRGLIQVKLQLFIKLTTCIISLLLHQNLTGQQVTFSKVFEFDKYNGGWSVIEVNDGYVLSGAGVGPTFQGKAQIRILKIDLNGNLLWKKTFGHYEKNYFTGQAGSLISINYNEFALVGAVTDSLGTDLEVLLIRCNSEGDTLWTHLYGDFEQDASQSITITSDKGFAMIGFSGTQCYLVKTDSLGTFQWQKKYGGSGAEEGKTIAVTHDNGFIIGAYTQSIGRGHEDGYVIKTDAQGVVQWDTTFGTTGFDCAAGVTTTMDGGYLVAGCLDSFIYVNNETPDLNYVVKLDTDGHLVWRRHFLSMFSALYRAKELPDESIIAVGEKLGTSFRESRIWIVKLDSDGNVIWEREHTYYQNGIARDTWLGDLILTSDGGMLVGGTAVLKDSLGFNRQDYWLLKLEGNGCLKTANCGITVIEELEPIANSLKIYPSPATNQLIIEPQSPTGTFTLYDITGKTQLQQSLTQPKTIIDITHLPAGLYLYEAGLTRGKVQVVR